MKRVCYSILAAILLLSLTACGNSAAKWQEQYDLGMRYLEDGNYEEAIIAFEAAIKIDPKQNDAYVALAKAYLAIGDMDLALSLLQYDDIVRSFLVYETARDEKQYECLKKRTFEYFKTGIMKETQYDVRGEVSYENMYIYQFDGLQIIHQQPYSDEIFSIFVLYDNDHIAKETTFVTYNDCEYMVREYDQESRMICRTGYKEDDLVESMEMISFHANGTPHIEATYFPDSEWELEYEFDETGAEIRQTSSYGDQIVYNYVYEYDANGNQISMKNTVEDGIF